MRTQRLSVRLMHSGFTLIELIIVIVIVGIMAAIAIPKYNEMTNEAKTAALKGVGGARATAAATNYALKKAGLTGGIALGSCTAAKGLVSGVPTEISITATALATDGTTTDCVLSHSGGGTPVTIQVLGTL